MPASNVFKVPGYHSDDPVAAILDPLGNAAHTALSFDLVGEDVLITGAGPIGIMAVAIARHAGARHVVITDVNDYRLELAARMGATRGRQRHPGLHRRHHVRPGHARRLRRGPGDVRQCPGLRDLLQAMNYGGQVAILGIPPGEVSLDWTQMIFKGLKLKGIYGREMFETWYKMSSMLQSRLDISAVITHRFAVDDYQQAFDIMRSGQSGKVIMDWT